LLPRFRIDSGLINLKDALIALGVPLFDPDSAPLSELIEEKIPVWLENAVQKAVIEVDEKGTTAAAVTVMEARTTSMPIPTEPFEMVCDKPFALFLYGRSYNDTSHILFTGVVNQPE
jgi:serpin B